MYIAFYFCEGRENPVRRVTDCMDSVRAMAPSLNATSIFIIHKSGRLHIGGGMVKKGRHWKLTRWQEAVPDEYDKDTLKNTYLVVSSVAE